MDEKATIVAKKQTGFYSNRKIADEHGVSLTTVDHLSLATLPADTLELAKRREEEFKQLNAENRQLVSEVINEKLRDRTIKDGTLAQLLTATNTAHRLAHEQSTEIVSNDHRAFEDLKERYYDLLMHLASNYKLDEKRGEPLSVEDARTLVEWMLSD